MFKPPFPLPKFVLAPKGQFCVCGQEIPAGTPSFHFSHCNVYFCSEHSVKAHRSWQKNIGAFLKEKSKTERISKKRLRYYPKK